MYTENHVSPEILEQDKFCMHTFITMGRSSQKKVAQKYKNCMESISI
jgi:hypothetical protein